MDRLLGFTFRHVTLMGDGVGTTAERARVDRERERERKGT